MLASDVLNVETINNAKPSFVGDTFSTSQEKVWGRQRRKKISQIRVSISFCNETSFARKFERVAETERSFDA